MISAGPENDGWGVRAFPSLAEAAQTLNPGDEFVLALPMSAILAQRLRLPQVEPAELREMVRIQLEKALPFPTEEVTSDFEVISQVNGDCVVSAVAVQNQRLAQIAAPLLQRNAIPQAVTVYAAQRIASHRKGGRALLIYPEDGTLVSAISENGKLSFARMLTGGVSAPLEIELPQLALSAELQGIDASFENVLVDEKCFEMRGAIERTLDTRAEIVGLETPPAATELNLLPQEWRDQRLRHERRGQWRRRLLFAGAAYLALILLFLLHLVYLHVRIHQLDRQLATEGPKSAFVRAAAANWKMLAPAVDPHFYPIEILQHLFESLPSAEVHITQFNESGRQLSIEGEANSAALAYQFIEKVKKNPGLQQFVFDMQAPRIMPNDHAQFRVEGKPR